MTKYKLTVLRNEDGLIDGCHRCSYICGYRCCHQSLPDDGDFGPGNSILLYPDEWDLVTEETKKHLIITMENFDGGKLAYCDGKHFDQSKCHPSRNFKPLDCESYPFAPAIKDGKLVLLVDVKRCPLSAVQLRKHYDYVIARWKKVLEKNPDVTDWIKSLPLPEYVPYDPKTQFSS